MAESRTSVQGESGQHESDLIADTKEVPESKTGAWGVHVCFVQS